MARMNVVVIGGGMAGHVVRGRTRAALRRHRARSGRRAGLSQFGSLRGRVHRTLRQRHDLHADVVEPRVLRESAGRIRRCAARHAARRRDDRARRRSRIWSMRICSGGARSVPGWSRYRQRTCANAVPILRHETVARAVCGPERAGHRRARPAERFPPRVESARRHAGHAQPGRVVRARERRMAARSRRTRSTRATRS